MKLHLPTALRRALLAITALLSPAVVTTTLATATLAAITAPAMAADLTLNAGSNAFDTDLTVEKIELASGVTSATLKPDTSTTLTVTADSICLASDQKLYLNNAKIIANKGIETLLTNVAGKDCIRMNTSSIWGSGGSSAHDVLLSSFINDKLYPNAQAYVYITKGHIQFDVGIDDVMGCYLGDGESEDSGIVSATISSELESLKIVRVASDATLDLGGGSKGFILNIRSLEGTVKTGRDLTLTGIEGWNLGYASISGSSSVCVEENSEASITLEHVKLLGGSVSAHNITILKDVIAYDYDDYESTLTATNVLHIQGDIGLENTIANAGSTIIDAGKSLTLGAGKFTTGAVTIGAGATLDLGSSTTNLKGIITNNGSLVLGGTITVDTTAFTAGTRERYSAGNNGYKITDTTYTVLTGGTVTGTATWKVGTQSATYENGMVIVDGIEDTAVYYVRNGDVAYTRTLANDKTTFSLDGGHLELNESLKDTQSIEWKSTASWLNIKNDAVELKSSQLSTVGAGNFTLIAPDGGTYIIDKKVGDIVELTLGTGVTLMGDYWCGTVKTAGDTTVSSDLDTTGWKNTELNGTTTVNSGVTLTLGGNTKLKGQIVNNGSLVLGGNITIDVASFADGTVTELAPQTYQQGSSLSSTTSGFATGGSIKIDLVTGNAAAVSDANWTVGNYKEFSFDGKVLFGTIEQPGTEFFVNDAVSYQKENAIFTNANGQKATELVLNGGVLTLKSDLAQGLKIRANEAGTVVVGGDVTLNADAVSEESSKDMSLTGEGTYTMSENANTLGTGVVLAEGGWKGTVVVNGAADALELRTLGTTGSTIKLGEADHKLATGDHTVTAKVEGADSSLTMDGGTLTLSGTTTLKGVYGANAISATDATISNGLTVDSISGTVIVTGGKVQEMTADSAISTSGSVSLSNVTLGAVLNNSGTLSFSGQMMLDTALLGDTPNNENWYATSNAAGEYGYTNGSGFLTIREIYTVVTGTAADNTASWKADNRDAEYADGKVLAFQEKNLTTYWVNTNSEVILGTADDAFTGDTTTIALNGGKLVMDTHTKLAMQSHATSTIEIGNAVTLNAAQLDASAADVTLSGKGSYTLGASANALNTGVGLGSDWSGTVKLTGAADALELSSLGNALSSIDLGSFTHTLADGEHVIDSALVGSGSLTLNKGKLTLNGDCSNWSGDIIGKVELELTKGGTIGGNVQVDSLLIGESSTTFEKGLITTGTITVKENATLSLNGNTTLGGKISNSGTLKLGGNITIDSSSFAAEDVLTINPHYQQGSKAESMTSGFRSVDGMKIKVVTGNAADATNVNWSVSDVTNGYCTFDAASGELHVVSKGSVGTAFYINTGDAINYDNADAAFKNIKGQDATELVLNGGNLVLSTELLNSTMKITANQAGSVEIGNNVNLYASQLNASQLAASADKVTLSGEGAYTLESGANTLGEGVIVGTGWRGTVYTGSTAKDAALNITALGNSQSTVYLGDRPMLRSTPAETVLESLIAAGVGTTETPGSLTLQKGESTADALVVNGILTLGSADAVASLVAVSVDAQALNLQLTDEVLSNKDAGDTLKLVTLEKGFEGALTFNDSTETERVRSEDNRKEFTLAWNEDGTVLTLTILGTETYVAEQVKPTTHNGKAGVALMTDVFLNSRPQKDAPDGALAGILNAVDAGTATDRDMAAVAGASTAALGMALSGDVERQLSAIRNRSLAGNDAATVTLVDEKSGMVSAEAPARFFAWVNAEGNRAEQNDDSTAAGYTLTSWGGTLGAGMQVNDQLTLGLALTAMYGDLQSDGPDYLKGDMDTTYVSAFARYNRGKWSHAFIGTAGTMEADYKRSAMSYSTDGDTDGTAFGLMYEVSREFELGNLSTLSPVLNIAYRHTAVDSYSESGADAALNVGKQSMDTVTLGAGARYAAVVGQQTLNRACGFEARALVKYDLGDRQSTTSTGFTGYATRAGIESAELGAFGVELGAGISVPVGTGSIFADGAVELRSDYTNFNAAVGYRVQF